jgi:hypothetical protein
MEWNVTQMRCAGGGRVRVGSSGGGVGVVDLLRELAAFQGCLGVGTCRVSSVGPEIPPPPDRLAARSSRPARSSVPRALLTSHTTVS